MTGLSRREAFWWAQDYAYASRAWIGSHVGAADPNGYADGTGRPVVILPGVYENWQFLKPLILGLHAAGHPVHVLPELGHNIRPIAEGAAALRRYLETHDLRGVAVVAHSKGGLIGKLAMTNELAQEARIAVVVAICTPFGGARRARYLPWPGMHSLLPGDVSLVELAAAHAVNARVVSLYGTFDPHIPEGSELAGATNVTLPVAGHFRILAQPETLSAVLAAIT
ncbi:MAG: esterase/lipase family protein [Propionicimonas sp.]